VPTASRTWPVQRTVTVVVSASRSVARLSVAADCWSIVVAGLASIVSYCTARAGKRSLQTCSGRTGQPPGRTASYGRNTWRVTNRPAAPMAIPLRHFVLALGFLVVGVGGSTVMTVATLPGLAGLAHLHLLLVGWIAVTIMGAMTQFVPVWSGVTIHSRRLAVAQLWLVTAGLTGFAAALLVGALEWLPVGGALMLAGIWVFVYNVGRTLTRARPFDFTERASRSRSPVSGSSPRSGSCWRSTSRRRRSIRSLSPGSKSISRTRRSRCSARCSRPSSARSFSSGRCLRRRNRVDSTSDC